MQAFFRALFRALGASTGKARPRPQRPDPPILDVITETPPTVIEPPMVRPRVTFDLDKLRAVKGITHGVLFVGSDEVMGWGDSDRPVDIASCSRSFVTLAWLVALSRGFVPKVAIDLPIRTLFNHAAPAQAFEPDVTLAHLLSYTSGSHPSGSRWQYSGGKDARGKHWPRQHVLFKALVGAEMWDFLNLHVLPVLGGLTAKAQDDGTCRVVGSVRHLQKWARLMLDGGEWQGVRLVDADLVARATAGGPQGDGHPFPLEGWQIHLIRSGKAWEYEAGELTGVPDGFAARDGAEEGNTTGHGAIVGLPAWDVTFAYRGDRFDQVIRQVSEAVTP